MNTSFKRRLQLRFSPRVAIGFRLRTTRPSFISYSELMCVTHSQAAVTPQLLPGPKAMWRIHRGNDQGASNRSQLWNGSQQGEGPVAPALHQHRLFSSLSQ